MTVAGRPLIASDDPIALGFALSRCRQKSWLTITTTGAPGLSSSGPKPRPIAGVTPSIGNRFAVTTPPDTMAGSNDFPVTVVWRTESAAS
jgi:hypothetical protein